MWVVTICGCKDVDQSVSISLESKVTAAEWLSVVGGQSLRDEVEPKRKKMDQVRPAMDTFFMLLTFSCCFNTLLMTIVLH